MDETVNIVTPSGNVGSVPKDQLQDAIARGAKPATPDDIQHALYGGAEGGPIAAALGALDVAGGGGGTALAQELGRSFGGAQGQERVEEGIRGYTKEHPIAHVLGEVAPLALMPENEGAIAEVLPQGGGLAGRIARFAGPKFARGAAEMEHLQGLEGVSEDLLDHDLSAESYWAHTKPGEALLGGLLNVGVSAGFKGIGKGLEKIGEKPLADLAGKQGAVAARDAQLFDDAITAGQRAGMTSDETGDAIRKLQDLAVRRQSLPQEERLLFDKLADKEIKLHASDSATARQFRLIYDHGHGAQEALEKTLDGHAASATRASNEMLDGLMQAERGQFALKSDEIRRLIDHGNIQKQTDAAIRTMRELRSLVTEPALPPEVAPIETFEKRVLREAKRQGTRIEPEGARAWAEVARESAVAEREAALREVIGKHTSHIGEDVPAEFRGLTTRVGMPVKEISKLESLVTRMEMEVRAAREAGDGARVYAVLDDAKRIMGQKAFGGENNGVAARFKRWFYETRLRPLLEDTNTWGEPLGRLQADTNEAYAQSKRAVDAYRGKLAESLKIGPDGMPVYSTDEKAMRSLIRNLGTDPVTEREIVQGTIDATRQRAAAMGKNMALDPGMQAQLTKAMNGAKQLQEILDAAAPVAEDMRGVQALRARESSFGPSGIVGKLLGAATSPARTLEMLSGFKKAESQIRKWIRGESKGFLSGETVPVVKALSGEVERKAAIRAIQDVQKYRSEPRNLATTLRQVLGAMPDVTPQMAGAVATLAARGIFQLATYVPSPLPPRLNDKSDEPRYAPSELDAFWRKKRLFEDPKLAAQLFRSGQLHEEDAKFLENVSPRLLSQLRIQLLSDIEAAKKNGNLRTMSYQDQLMLSWMTGQLLDSTQNPQFVRSMQETAANDPINQASIGQSATGGGRPPGRKVDIDLDRYKTTTQHLEE